MSLRAWLLLVCVGCQVSGEQEVDVRGAKAETLHTQQISPSHTGVALDGTCATPATTVPTYSRPFDDRIAVSSFLGASGFASSDDSNWVDMAAGNLCGASEPELVLLRNTSDAFSIMRGSSPYRVGTGNLQTNGDVWRAIAAGAVDSSGQDSMVAVRHSRQSGEADVVVLKADSTTCNVTTTVATAVIGGTTNSLWAGVAVGNFVQSGVKQIALLRNSTTAPNLVIASVNGTGLTTRATSNLNASATLPWVAVAGGDMFHDGTDELVTLQRAAPTRGTNVFVYRWTADPHTHQSSFLRIAAFSDPNSNWTKVTLGDFNGDGAKSIVVSQNSAPNFTVLKPGPGGTLSVIATSNLESDTSAGQDWYGLAAADLITAYDQGAQELVALRAAHTPYRADLFVYGDRVNRVQRDSGLAAIRSQGYTESNPTAANQAADIQALKDSHTNTYNWILESPGDYTNLVTFLRNTTGVCVDGQQLRVVVTLFPGTASNPPDAACSQPEETNDTTFEEASFFSTGIAKPSICGVFTDPNGGWPALLGNLALEYPQLVAVGFDDFSGRISSPTTVAPIMTEEMVAEFESRLHEIAPWVSFAPTFYYIWQHDFIGRELPDYGKLLDTVVFFFRNSLGEHTGACDTSTGCVMGLSGSGGTPNCPNICTGSTCAEATIPNLPSQLCDMRGFLPPGSPLQLGIYYAGLYDCGVPSVRYDYDMTKLIEDNKWLGVSGVSVYGLYLPTEVCNASNVLTDPYCAVQIAFSDTDPNTVTNLDLTVASCQSPATPVGRPFGWVEDSAGTENVVYRGSNGHIYELWRAQSTNGYTDLTAAAGTSTTAVSDPNGFVSYDGSEIVVYKGNDGRVHELNFWTNSAGVSDLIQLDGVGIDGGASGFANHSQADNSLIYRNGGLIGVSYSQSTFGQTLSSGGVNTAAGDAFGYVSEPAMSQDAIYRSTNGHIHDLSWWLPNTGATNNDLTALTSSAVAAGDPVAYFTNINNTHESFYRTAAGDLYEIYWFATSFFSRNLTLLTGAHQPAYDPTAFFDPVEGTNHVMFPDSSSHLFEMSWFPGGSVITNDLTYYAQQFPPTDALAASASRQSSYYDAFDHSHHLIYTGEDGHIHDLYWGKVSPP